MPGERPKVSVLITTYNHERFIRQCVESALAQQTTFEFEVVVGDDASTDRTPAILQELEAQSPERVRLLLRGSNLGNQDNFADVYSHSSGEYIAILDGDDYWIDSRKLQLQADALDQHSDWSGCFHRTVLRNECGFITTERICPQKCPPEVVLSDVLRAHLAFGQAVMYRKHPSGHLPAAWLDNRLIGDWPLSILHATQGKLGFLPLTMSVYRQHRAGIWSGNRASEKARDNYRTLHSLARCVPPECHEALTAAQDRYLDDHFDLLDAYERSYALRFARIVGPPFAFIGRICSNIRRD